MSGPVRLFRQVLNFVMNLHWLNLKRPISAKVSIETSIRIREVANVPYFQYSSLSTKLRAKVLNTIDMALTR